MKRVAILTTFSSYDEAYSLNIVAKNQIKMLLLAGYEPTVIVHDTFDPQDIYTHPKVKLETIPNVPVHNEVRKDETFDDDVRDLQERLEEILKNIDVVLTHDVVYQNACLKHNFACRAVAKKLPNLRWLHWIHSATNPLMLNAIRPIFQDEYANLLEQPFPNSFYIYPNTYAVPSVSKNFNISIENVKTVHHPTDICSFLGISPEVEEIVYSKNIFSADAMATYPIRLDRGKQVQYVIKTMAKLKDFGLTIRIVIVDFHSTGGDKVVYRDELKQLGIDLGLSSDELMFTSELREEWAGECKQSVVRDFQLLSNVFILPSVSETYSLVTQEAALLKQVVVLNQDFPPFRSIYGENAIYRKYSSNFDIFADVAEAGQMNSNTTTKYGPGNIPDEARQSFEMQYHYETAGMIAHRLKHPEMALSRKLIKERNVLTVFKRELEPLFYV